MSQTKNLADFHMHSIYSFDGVFTPQELVESCKKNHVKWISITDHNNLEGVQALYDKHGRKNLSPYIDVDGVNVVSGVEVTCRVSSVVNKKNTSSKVHLIVYGATLEPNSPLVKLMKIKHKNDRDYDYGVLEYLLSLKPGHNITQDHIRNYIQDRKKEDPHYSTMSQADVYHFLTIHGITLAKSFREFKTLLDKAPKYERINIEAQDLIDVAHASGGIVVMAHPGLNLRRTNKPKDLVRSLLDSGLDGFESLYHGVDSETMKMIQSIVAENKKYKNIIFTGGSDTHSFNNGVTLGKYGREEITIHNQKPLIDEMERLKKAREIGSISNRSFDNVSPSEISDILDMYIEIEKTLNECNSARTTKNNSVMTVLTRKETEKRSRKAANKVKRSLKKSKKARNKSQRGQDVVGEQDQTLDEKEAYEQFLREMEEMYSENNDC